MSNAPTPGTTLRPAAAPADRDAVVREVARVVEPVPDRRLGEVLRAGRQAATTGGQRISVRAAAETAGVSARRMAAVEAGRSRLDAPAIARLLELYGCTIHDLLPPRRRLSVAVLPQATEGQLLRSYLDLVQTWRGAVDVESLRFRRDDLEVLVELLGTDVPTIERRLVALTGCTPATARRFRQLLIAGVTASALLVPLCAVGTGVAQAASSPRTTAAAAASNGVRLHTGPMAGLLGATTKNRAADLAAGVNAGVVGVQWSRAEPSPGVLDTAYLATLRAAVDSWRAAGADVVLSPGLQYTPSWVFSIPGSRFVDQHGRSWVGSPGEDVADAVWNTQVRAAQARYLTALGRYFDGAGIAVVRTGGLLNGELRLPDRSLPYNSYWGFSAAARASDPVKNWKPGQSGRAQASAFLTWYLGGLVDYEKFVVATTQSAFPSAQQQVLLPNWGIRPGEVQQAVDGNLSGRSPAEQNGTLQQGLDWPSQVAALPKGVMVYSTNLGAADRGTAPQQVSPIAYLAQLATPRGLALGGENEGKEGMEVFRRCTARVQQLGLQAFFWMNESDFYRDGKPTAALADYARALKTIGVR